MATPQKIAEIIMLFRAAGLQNGPETDKAVQACCEAWLLTLDDLPDGDLAAAARAWMRVPQRGRWWPTPADLLEVSPAVKSATRQVEAAKVDDGSRWWPLILRAVGSIGGRSQDWQDRLIPALENQLSEPSWPTDREAVAILYAVRSTGWRAIADSNHDAQRAGLGRTFQAAYRRALVDEVAQGLPDNVKLFPAGGVR